MRIRDFAIDRFGILHDQRVADLPPGVTVFLGDNEAGKSTCLNFFRAMLFGYARNRRSIDYLAGSKAASGGSLTMESDSLGLVTLRRTPGTHGGPFTLAGQDGQPRSADDLARLLRGCTPELYDKVFAFSLDELMRISSMQDDRVRHALHGAAFGMGMRSPNRVLKELDDAMRRIFAPRATTSRLQMLLAEFETLHTTIREGGNEVARYAELGKELDDASLALSAAREERARLEEERRVHERRMALCRRWEEVREADAALEALPDVAGTFSPDGRERLERLAERLEERESALLAARGALRRAEDEMAALVFNPDLADAAPALLSLLERKESIREGASRLLSLEQETLALEREWSRVCGELGPGWDERRVLACDLSLGTHDACARLGQEHAAAAAALARADDDHARTQRDREAALQARSEVESALGALRSETFGDDGPDLDEAGAEILQRLLLRAKDAHGRASALAAGLRSAGQALDQSIAAIAPDWTRRHLEELAIPPAGRERLLEAARGVTLAETAVSLAAHERDAAALVTEEARQRVAMMRASIRRDAADAGLDGPPASFDPEKRRARLRRAQHARKVLDSAGQAYGAANEQLGDIASLRAGAEKKGPPWGMALLFTGVFAMVGGGGAAYIALANGPALLRYCGVGGFMLGIALAVAGVVLLVAGRGTAFAVLEQNWTGIEQRLIRARQAARTAMDEAEAALLQLAREDPDSFPGGSFDAETLADAELRVHRQIETLALLARDRKNCEREEAALASLERRLATLHERLEACGKARDEARAAWEAELAAFSLPVDACPHEARALLETVDTALARRAAWESRLAESRDAETALADCLALARSIAPLADRLASVPEPGDHLAPDPGPWLDEVESFLTRWRVFGRERARLEEVLGERTIRLEETTALLAGAQESLARARARAEAARAAWQSWLAENHLPATLAPETARLALDAIARARTCLEQRDRLKERIAVLRGDIRHFAEALAEKASLAPDLAGGADAAALASSLAGKGEEAASPDPVRVANALTFLDDISACARECQQIRARRADRENELPALRDAVAVALEQAATARAAIDDLLRLAGCATPEAFHAAHAIWTRREAALAERNARRAGLERDASDMGISLDEAVSSFAAGSREEMERGGLEREEAFAAMLEREQALAERKGSLDAAMAGLLNEDGLLALLRRREALRGEMETLAGEWSRLALARELLLTAKRRFESERQTGVVQHAGQIFAAITDGAYSGITVSLDDEDVRAIARDGSARDPETELSRGTREQLYLALRLAYVRDHGMQAEKLPVIMDDILVNFDATRARNTARAIAAFARDFQVLFFTCHAATADMLMETAPESACYTIARGEFARLEAGKTSARHREK